MKLATHFSLDLAPADWIAAVVIVAILCGALAAVGRR
jgi:hypothetical protein